ncbi:hypothetical protein BaRGS_00033814, partial [Batillaria attramentaria]
SPDEQMMATRVAGNFLPVPSAKWQVEYMPTAGIKLLNVAASGTGNYSVHVNINLHGSVVTETQTVGVQVNENTADCTTDAERLVAMEALVNSLTSQNNQLQQERDNLTRLVQTLTSEDVLAYHSESGVYTLHLDPDTPDGRWMFHRGWQEYVDGFGDIHTEFWL